MCLLGFPTFLGQNSVMPQYGERGAEGSKTKNLSFFRPFDSKSKVVQHIKKSPPPKSIRWRDMVISLLFDLEKVPFILCLPSKLSQEVEIRYVHLIGDPRCDSWSSQLFSPILPSHSPNMWFFGWDSSFFSFFEFVPRITSFQIELGNWNQVCAFNRNSGCAFLRGPDFLAPLNPSHSYC